MRWARGGTVAAAVTAVIACGGASGVDDEANNPCLHPVIFHPLHPLDEPMGVPPPAFWPRSLAVAESTTGLYAAAVTLVPNGDEQHSPYLQLPDAPGEYRVRSRFFVDGAASCTREDSLRVVPSRPCSELTTVFPAGPDPVPPARLGATLGMMPDLTMPVRVEQTMGRSLRFELVVGGVSSQSMTLQSNGGTIDALLVGTNEDHALACTATIHVDVGPACPSGHPSLMGLAGSTLSRKGWTSRAVEVGPGEELELSVDDPRARLHVTLEEGVSGGQIAGSPGSTARYTAPLALGRATLRAVVAIDGTIVCVARQVLVVK